MCWVTFVHLRGKKVCKLDWLRAKLFTLFTLCEAAVAAAAAAHLLCAHTDKKLDKKRASINIWTSLLCTHRARSEKTAFAFLLLTFSLILSVCGHCQLESLVDFCKSSKMSVSVSVCLCVLLPRAFALLLLFCFFALLRFSIKISLSTNAHFVCVCCSLVEWTGMKKRKTF